MGNRIDLQDQVAIVTGGAQGIGRVVAETLSHAGAKVAIWDRDPGLAAAAAARIGGGVLWYEVDVTDPAGIDAALAQTQGSLGPVSILVHSAGIAGPNAPLTDYPLRDWQQIIDVNLTGTFNVNRAVVARMAERAYGRVVNIASIAGKEGNPNASAYSASKAGVIALTKSLGKELAHLDVAVNCITPAAARTAIFDQMSTEHVAYMLSKIPRGRFLETQEVADMVAFLVSSQNSFTTAAVFDLSGGRATY